MKQYNKPELMITEFNIYKSFAASDDSADPGLVFDDDSVFVGEVEGYIIDD